MASVKVVERFSKYQILQFFFTCLPAVFNSMSNVNFVFVAGDLNYRCRVPECEKSFQKFSPTWWPNTVTDRCTKPILNDSWNNVCTNTSFVDKLEKCTGWIYETNNTVIAQLDLACQPIKANMIGTIHNIAMAISMLLAGWIADRIGRKPTLIICSTSIFLGIFKTFTSSYYVYLSLEFLESIMSGGVITAGLVLMIETCGRNKRVLSGVLFAYSIYLGEVIFACVAMAVSNWKNLIYIVYAPTILFLLYIPITKESLRWLIVNNKIDAAKDIVKTIIKMNKLDMDPKEIDKMDTDTLKIECDVETYELKEGLIDALKCREIVKRLIVATFCRFTVCFIYYGLTVNSVMLPGNKYTNFLLTSLMSFPGDFLCMILMNRYGRRPPLIYGYAIAAVTCVLFALVSEELNWLKITFYLISKLVIAACYTGVVTYIMELFPTSVRASLLGLCILTASAGTTLAPLTPTLSAISPILTSAIFGISCLISSLLLFLTPETSTMQLVDTIEQLEAMGQLKQNKKHPEGRDNSCFDNSVENL